MLRKNLRSYPNSFKIMKYQLLKSNLAKHVE